MKWYFASRMRHKANIAAISEFLKKNGQTVTSEWAHNGSLKPYEQNIPDCQLLSKEIVRSLLDTDIFVLISDPEGTDMFIELGVCLAKSTLSQNITIYIVGKHAKRSLMHLHPSIVHAVDMQEVFEREKIAYQGFDIPDFN
ncbi:hypothetical protein A2609_03020 [Candidatus Kaiserbacteria bacterium RIFOXYD1_FULL_47_14]|uniref:Nucleoside 2-deoxyribosyltransferase n=1 Tax=Candidatus Kaiserbacteria bacterium RIFOXYD1_FULL_47_14 TaxID=1798533 RepID=A0A1F6G4Y8_9BACT|nr:MAG: hypothetical protein A2609_03020 [Candidatus Kaiserbacteria bacterium RIFOXYD1_FULL_47_14]